MILKESITFMSSASWVLTHGLKCLRDGLSIDSPALVIESGFDVSDLCATGFVAESQAAGEEVADDFHGGGVDVFESFNPDACC
jgi:hypothetical protein